MNTRETYETGSVNRRQETFPQMIFSELSPRLGALNGSEILDSSRSFSFGFGNGPSETENLPLKGGDPSKLMSGRALWLSKIWIYFKKLAYDLRAFSRRVLWLNETMSLLISCIALALIAAILAAYQDKTLPEWPSLISINSLISIFTSVLKAAMLFPIAEGISELKWAWFTKPRHLNEMDRFDAASRGPLGSLTLFNRSRISLASLGALITILALAIDPFTQQILQYYDCPQPLEATVATVARTNNYTTSGIINRDPQRNLVTDSSMTLGISQALMNSSGNASSNLAFDCQSGNCTFPQGKDFSYTSLGMCSSVGDISYLVSGASGNYSMRDGRISTNQERAFSIADVTNLLTWSEDRQLFVVEALIVLPDCQSLQDQNSGHCRPKPYAFIASLYPCIYTYGNSRISKSVLRESIVSTTPLPLMLLSSVGIPTTGGNGYSLVGDYPSFPGADCSPSSKRAGNKTQATSLFRSGLRHTNWSAEVAAQPDTIWYDPACAYEFRWKAVQEIQSYLSSLFGTLEEPQGMYCSGNISSGSPHTAYDTYNTCTCFENPWIDTLYANGTTDITRIRAFVQNLADAMTAVIRKGGDIIGSAPATGTVLVNRTCIHVAWTWLLLPIALLLLTLIFFVATMVKSRKVGAIGGQRGAWKSSSLPLLWCRLERSTKRQHDNFAELKEMQECADEVRVRLLRNNKESGEREWTFREV